MLLGAVALAAGVAIGALVTAARDDSAAGTQVTVVDAGVLDALPTGKEAIGVELAFAPGGLRYVTPGNRVTVWATPAVPAGQPVIAQVLLQDVEVLATTPGAGARDPDVLAFLLALSRDEAAALIAEQARSSGIYFTVSDNGD